MSPEAEGGRLVLLTGVRGGVGGEPADERRQWAGAERGSAAAVASPRPHRKRRVVSIRPG